MCTDQQNMKTCKERHEAELYCHIQVPVYSTKCPFRAYFN